MGLMARFGTTFVAHSSENAVATAASSALAVLTAENIHVHGPLPTAGLAVVYAALGALASRHVGPGKTNGTASFNPNVVVASRRARVRRRRS